MTASLTALLLQLSESGDPAILWGRQAKPYFGKDFDRLLNSRLLVEEARAEEWDRCDACECDHDVRLIHEINGQFIAACPISSRSDSVLDPEDMRSFKINLPALVAEVAKASGFSNEPSEVIPGVWRLGMTATKRQLFMTLNRSALARSGLIGTLRLSDPASQISVISPVVTSADRVRFMESGIVIETTQECLRGENGSWAIDLLKLEGTPQIAPRLLIKRIARFVTLDGEPKTLTEQSFKLLVFLAENAKRSAAIVDNREIEKHLWGSGVHRISSQTREPIRSLKNALTANGANKNAVKALIENKRNPNGYRLALEPSQIDLRD